MAVLSLLLCSAALASPVCAARGGWASTARSPTGDSASERASQPERRPVRSPAASVAVQGPDGESSEVQPARFRRLGTVEGLSYPIVLDTQQDQQGFMWFATSSGLDRYDGYGFTAYEPDPADPAALPFVAIEDIHVDQDGVLWVASGGGLSKRNPATGTFTHPYRQGQVYCLHEGGSGILWFGTYRGLFGLNRSTSSIEYSYQRDADAPLDATTISDNRIVSILEDRSGDLWITTASGLDRLDVSAGNFTHYEHYPDDPEGAIEAELTTLYEDSLGRLWMGTGGAGLYVLDVPSGSYAHLRHDPQDPDSLGSDWVLSVMEDNAGRLWLGTTRGLDRIDPWLDPSTGSPRTASQMALGVSGQSESALRFVHLRHDPADPHSLSDDVILSLYEDQSGLVWIGTANGSNVFGGRGQAFSHLPGHLDLAGESEQAASAAHALAIAEDSSDTLWVSTLEGLVRQDRSTGQRTFFQPDPDAPAGLGGEVRAIFEDRSGVLWIGTANGRLPSYDPLSQSFVTRHDLNGGQVVQIAEDTTGSLWIAALGGLSGGGLYRLSADREDLTRISTHPDDLDSLNVSTVTVDRAGAVWVGGLAVGITVLEPRQDLQQDRFTHYQHNPDNNKTLSSNIILSIYEDASVGEGSVWIGTLGGGLNRFDRARQTFTHFTQEDGLADNTVGCMLADAAGFLWLATPKGLSRFDPRTETFRNYDERDGVLSHSMYVAPQLCLRSSDGRMLFGGINGIDTFFPDQIQDNRRIPPVAITEIRLSNSVVRTHIPADEHIRLSRDDNFIAIEFAALDFMIPEKNQYAYMMQGLDRDWVYAGTRRYAEYPNLQPGDYVFRVRGSNNDGYWNEEGAALRITIEPNIGQTWAFRISAAAALLLGAYGFYRQRIKNIQARSQELEAQVEERTAALRRETDQRLQAEEALRQSEMEKAIAAERSRLARELHDAVTQTLFSASLVAQALPTTWERDREEGRRLLSQLRQLSQGAQAEMRTLLLELRPSALVETSLPDLLRQLADGVTGREGVPVELTVEGTASLPDSVHVALYRIAQEALNNVAKHARASQVSVSLRCTSSRTDETTAAMQQVAELCIRDDGRGFDPDAVTMDHLGLAIMRERAQAVGAQLTVDSSPGQGTQITVVWQADRGQDAAAEE